MIEIHVSVRNLVEFVMRSGNLDNRRSGASLDAMQEGNRIHRMIQKKMGSDYEAEVTLKYAYETDTCTIIVEGRADGILTEPSGITVDEIKGTYRDLHRLKEPVCTHSAQAKCYAFFYGKNHNLDHIKVRVTYCNIDTEEMKIFEEEYSVDDLQTWFEQLILEYKKWADFEALWKQKRQESIDTLEFPFPYREGQRDLVKYVYQTIYHQKKLFIEAPTGVGKTISTVFPAIKAMGNGMGDKLFYLTAKTITGTVADQTFSLLRERGLAFKSVALTAKDKICFMEERECNPDACPYAKGHYDRINDAIYDLLITHDTFNRERVEEYAQKHRVCPFELCLDMSLFSDGIICDYNYAFDPHVYLKRFFAEGNKGNYLFLVDEAHNLLERGREMYSAVLVKEDFLELKKLMKLYDVKIEKQLDKCNKELLLLKRDCESYQIVDFIDPLVNSLVRLYTLMDNYLDENEDSPIKKTLLEFFFVISHFLEIYERVDENYTTYTQMNNNGSFFIKQFCVNPAKNLKECMQRAKSTILFSATLLPIQYYKNLLGGTGDDYEVYAHSVFDPNKRVLLIGNDVTSRYTRRCREEYERIAGYLHEMIRNRHGNYMAFFPSHSFLQSVYEVFLEQYGEKEDIDCVIQEDFMDDVAREQFLLKFQGNESFDFSELVNINIEEEEEKSLLGFCVLGGIFGEGIDLKNDSLIGVAIIGTGIPQVCNEREILKNYFDESGQLGFDYAYRYPGMNKVLQAAGRVIRTSEDIGIIALLDDRFLNPATKRLFPREWEYVEVVSKDTIASRVERFWNEWL